MTQPPIAGTVAESSDPAARDLAMQLAHGQAALLLVECLMLALIEQKIVTADEMVGAVETVLATKLQMVRDDEHPQIAQLAVGLLSRIGNSLMAAQSLDDSAAAHS
jgi:hypothetical protein